MHDIIQEQYDSGDEKLNLSSISSEAIIEKMMMYQTKSIDHLRPVNVILTAAEQEIASTFLYLDNYRNVSTEYFVQIVSQVKKMY